MIYASATIDDREFKTAMRNLITLTGDARPMLISIKDDWYKSNRQIFTLSGPGKYPDLTPRYKVRKQKTAGFVYPILKAQHGRIEAGLTDEASPYTIKDIQKQHMVLGVNVPYAIFHQTGAHGKKRPMVFNAKNGGEMYAIQMRRWRGVATDYYARRFAALKQGGLS